MARLKNGSIPTYRFHKARNCAVVTIDGRNHYLGPFGSPSSRQKYARLIRAHEAQQEQAAAPAEAMLPTGERPTINELILVFLKHAIAYYKPNHGENKEAGCIDDALRVLQDCGYGREPADVFRPKDLKVVREAMIQKNWSRNYINSQINRIKRMFRYAVEEDLVPGTVYHGLLAVRGLRRGAPGARETARVKPVPIKHINAVLKRAHPILKAMIVFAYYTGARPGEVCALRPQCLRRNEQGWVYDVPPEANKTDVHDRERRIFIGPRAQRALAPWLENLRPDEFVFSPARAEMLRNALRRANRKVCIWPSHVRCQLAKRQLNPKRAKRQAYDPASFRRAVTRCCQAVGVPCWNPGQLRHNAGTRFRKRFGLETARILLGHSKLTTTEVYAERDFDKARHAAGRLG